MVDTANFRQVDSSSRAFLAACRVSFFSNTAKTDAPLPLIAAALVLSWVRRGWWRSLLLFAPAGVVYLVWYLVFSGGAPASLAPHGIQWVTSAPLFFGAMFAANVLTPLWLQS